MGRRNKSYSKDLHQQAYERLNGMQAFGESRRAAKVEGTDRDKIFSFNTYKSYWKHTKYFIKYIKEHHPECTTLKKARKYVGEWLQDSVDRGLSAWTIGGRPWESCTGLPRMTRTSSRHQRNREKISNGAAASGYGTSTSPRPIMTA